VSIYTECSAAARALERAQEPFTDFDIIDHARREEWSEADEQQGRHDAAQIAAAFYRAGRLVRFGPVNFSPEPDYARGDEGRLLYAAAQPKPRKLSTPNGDFPELFYEDDPLYKVGRRKGSTRNDLIDWTAQTPTTSVERERDGVARLEKQVERLEELLTEANARVDELEAECERLRSNSAAEAIVSHGKRKVGGGSVAAA
jgi:hypothetical protein